MTDFRSISPSIVRQTPDLTGAYAAAGKARELQDLVQSFKGGVDAVALIPRLQSQASEITALRNEISLDKRKLALVKEKTLLDDADTTLKLRELWLNNAKREIDLMKERELLDVPGQIFNADADFDFTQSRVAWAEARGTKLAYDLRPLIEQTIAANPDTPISDTVAQVVNAELAGEQNELIPAKAIEQAMSWASTAQRRALEEKATQELFQNQLHLTNSFLESFTQTDNPTDLLADQAAAHAALDTANGSLPISRFQLLEAVASYASDAADPVPLYQQLDSLDDLTPTESTLVRGVKHDLALKLDRRQSDALASLLENADNALQAMNQDEPTVSRMRALTALQQLDNPGTDWRTGKPLSYSETELAKRQSQFLDNDRQLTKALESRQRVQSKAAGKDVLLNLPEDEDEMERYLATLRSVDNAPLTRAQQSAVSLQRFGMLPNRLVNELTRLSNSPNPTDTAEAADMFLAIYQQNPDQATTLVSEKYTDPETGQTSKLASPLASMVRLAIPTNPLEANAPLQLGQTLELYRSTNPLQFRRASANLKVGEPTDKEEKANEQIFNVNEAIADVVGRGATPDFAVTAYQDLYRYHYLNVLRLNDTDMDAEDLHELAKERTDDEFKSRFARQTVMGDNYVIPSNTVIPENLATRIIKNELSGVNPAYLNSGDLELRFYDAAVNDQGYLSVPVYHQGLRYLGDITWPRTQAQAADLTTKYPAPARTRPTRRQQDWRDFRSFR